MGVFDAPTWVLAAWRRSLQDVGATADRSRLEAYGERMIERWSAPERIHHNLRRLIAVLARVDELAPETHDPDVVRLAAWYHGAVFNAAAQHAYAHRGGVDEAASAELARSELTELGVPAEVVERVAALILGIARHSAPKDDIDAQALCDADLGGLAAEPQRYAAYRKEVRAEYAHIPQADYVRARLAIVTKLLGRPHLFRSPMAQDWEDAARENLTAELNRLTVEARRLEAEGSLEPAEPRSGAREQAADGGAQVSPRVTGAPGALESRPVDVPRAAERPAAAAGAAGAIEQAGDAEQREGAASNERASIEQAPVGGPSTTRTFAEADRDDGEPVAPQAETVAQRSQRRWAEYRAREAAEQNAAKRSGTSGPGRRSGTSAPSAPEPAAADTGVNDGAQGPPDDLDESSSLSRPPRMPAIKRRPPEED